MRLGRVLASEDRLFADAPAGALSGDYAVLGRHGDDDYVRVASPATECDTLVEPAGSRDGFSEPARWEVVGDVSVVDGRWRLGSVGSRVRTAYDCYPTGGDFEARALLVYAPAQAAASLEVGQRVLVDGIAFFYGCCHLAGIGYARWWEVDKERYGGVRFALAGQQLRLGGLSGGSRWVTIRRVGGVLDLDGLIQVAYGLPERMGVRRLELDVVVDKDVTGEPN